MRLVLATDDVFEIGRRPLLVGSSESCDVRVAGAAPEHARIDGDDIEAIAPCEVGEVSLSPGERRRLVAGCFIELGEGRLRVEAEESSTSANGFTTRELALRGVAEPKRLWPTVVVVQGVNVGLELVLREERTFQVGRAATGDLALEDVDVSRAHVEIIRRGDGVLVSDLGSTRGTFLGRARLDAKRKALWTPERMLKVGRTVLALASPSWTRRLSERQPASEAASPGITASDVAAAPSVEGHEEAIVPIRAIAGPTAAIAEVPRAERAARTHRSRLFHGSFLVAMVAIVGLALAALVWVLWP